MKTIETVPHGGGLAGAVARHGGRKSDWIDLSTGMNPCPAAPSALPLVDLARLPDSDMEAAAVAAARAFYAFPDDAAVLATAGIQGIISFLPMLRPAGTLALVSPTYGEYAPAFRRSGWAVRPVRTLDEAQGADAVLAVNPNNPDGARHAPDSLAACHEDLAARGGLLIVDEAFGDVWPELSVSARCGAAGLLVLKSFGKFFGLAGLRLGFAAGHADDIAHLAALAGPWAVSAPALRAGAEFMVPGARETVASAILDLAARQAAVLHGAGLDIIADAGLFQLVRHADAAALHEALARRHVLTRIFDAHPHWIRFGLCGDATQREKLATALKQAV